MMCTRAPAASPVISTSRKGAAVGNGHGHLSIGKPERIKVSQLEGHFTAGEEDGLKGRVRGQEESKK